LRYVSGMDEMPQTPSRPASYILAAHPNWRESRVNRQLAGAAEGLPGVTVCDLYARYADYDIDVPAEQARAEAAQLIVLLHPIQWYSMPALLKLWVDEVLAYGWAYGSGGTALAGKDLWLVATTGGPVRSYHPQSYNRYFFDAFLPPYEQTAALCGMRFLPPLLLHGAHTAADNMVKAHVEVFKQRLQSYPHWPELDEIDACVMPDVPQSDRPSDEDASSPPDGSAGAPAPRMGAV